MILDWMANNTPLRRNVTQADVAQFQGGTVRVVGRMHRENGYAFLEADKLSLLSAN